VALRTGLVSTSPARGLELPAIRHIARETFRDRSAQGHRGGHQVSHPVKTPARLRKVLPDDLLALRVIKLFARHGAPASWGIAEAHFLVEFVFKGLPSVPFLRHVERGYREIATKTKSRETARMAAMFKAALRNAPRDALVRTRCFDRMMRTMDKADFFALLADVSVIWGKAFASPEFNLATEVGIRADDPEMWTAKA